MATIIRPAISQKNRYWIDKHRHYELKHFCLQYPSWKQEYAIYDHPSISSSMADRMPSSNLPGDPTTNWVMRKAYYQERIKLVEDTVRQADRYLYDYILKAVTEELSYNYLKTKMGIPCGRDMYYDRYRRFFWLLSKARD